MTAVFIYSAFALLLIVAVVLLIRSRRADALRDAEARCDEVGAFWEGSELALAERIFDRTDYLWLRDEVGSPAVAQSLLQHRRRIALRWLSAVRRSFDELMRTPGPAFPGSPVSATPESWQLLRLTLRFHCILGYAFLVVWLFGPYHRLIPSFGWLPSLFARPSAPGSYESADAARFP
jgi:hypothetical protein